MKRYPVAIYQSVKSDYPKEPPYSPNQRYPETPFPDTSSEGWVYEAVRETMHLLGMDAKHYGSPEWNPLSGIVNPGNTVVIKPNLVLDFNLSGDTTDCVTTHGSVIRPIVDYVIIALKGSGRVVIADSSLENSNFTTTKHNTGLDRLKDFYLAKGHDIDVLDLRKYVYNHGVHGFMSAPRKNTGGDPLGYQEIDLGKSSAFVELPHLENLYGGYFDRSYIRSVHNADVNKYLIPNTYLSADVIISVPKLKTHKKIGTTLNIKGLVGVCGYKVYLPHFRIGDPAHGGDEYPPVRDAIEGLLRIAKRRLLDTFTGVKTIRFRIWDELLRRTGSIYLLLSGNHQYRIGAGDWFGNKTVHRTVYDLAKAIFMIDKNGELKNVPQRRFFSFIDGIIGGEKEGPLGPSAKHSGVIIGGGDLTAVDMAATRLMGFDCNKMEVFRDLTTLPPDHPLQPVAINDISIVSNNIEWHQQLFEHPEASLHYIPHSAWIGHIEFEDVHHYNKTSVIN